MTLESAHLSNEVASPLGLESEAVFLLVKEAAPQKVVQHQKDSLHAISILRDMRGQNVQQNIDQGVEPASDGLNYLKAALKQGKKRQKQS